ncbi:MAG: hypothetical protein HC882_06030, partial [Acidobacteria bacterium]|nr:hypothetical protein [Acidobacteriota bacterium]
REAAPAREARPPHAATRHRLLLDDEGGGGRSGSACASSRSVRALPRQDDRQGPHGAPGALHAQGQAHRDVATSAQHRLSIWARGVSLITGKWRVETVAINGPVQICGVPVNAGDLVVADDNGVCFIPRARISEVLARAQALGIPIRG